MARRSGVALFLPEAWEGDGLAVRKSVNGGIYHLLIRLKEVKTLGVGRLGRQTFPEGYYIYTGSAKRGLFRRIERHLKRKKKHHWHIDTLTPVAQIERILIDRSGKYTECRRHEAIMNLPGAEVIVPRFGASDCRCPVPTWPTSKEGLGSKTYFMTSAGGRGGADS